MRIGVFNLLLPIMNNCFLLFAIVLSFLPVLRAETEKGAVFRVAADSPGSSLAVIAEPKITTPLYALVGEIKYERIKGTGYLELWNVFGSQQRYFSRSLADTGPLQKITGTTDWRPFVLPFDRTGADAPLSQLAFNVVLPQGGAVSLRKVRLVQYPSGTTLDQALADTNATGEWIGLEASIPKKAAPIDKKPKAWWDNTTGGWIGGITGVLAGLLGGFVGWTARKNPRRAASICLLVAIGGIFPLALGGLAFLRQQPYVVYYPLLLIGVLAPVVFGLNACQLVKNSRREELRRISAMDTPPSS